MNLESLPNELLLKSFRYLDAFEIFHSFDNLNRRFSTLIRNILLLHLDIGNIGNSKLTQFGIRLLLNPQIKDQIKSLILKKDDGLDNIRTLFSFFSLNDFSQLQSLVFSNMDTSSTNQLCSTLPLLSNLRYLCIESPSDLDYKVLEPLSSPTVKRLSIYTIPDTASICHYFVSLTHLTVNSCSVNGLCHFFKYSPMLRYLNIGDLSSSDVTNIDESQLQHEQANHLQRLVINEFSDEFDALEMLVQRTPNLKSFILRSYNHRDLINEHWWCQLLENYLPLLRVFRFIFHFSINDDNDTIADRLRLFQSCFSQHQDHWYTEYLIDNNNDEALIYTVPYMFNAYEITSNTKRYYSHSLTKDKIFAKVTHLTVSAVANDPDQYYFPNVKSLKLIDKHIDEINECVELKTKLLSYLKTMVNLCHLTSLQISLMESQISSSLILKLTREFEDASLFETHNNLLFLILENRELCECLKKIKYLNVENSWWGMCLNSRQMAKCFETFSNIEEFVCEIFDVDTLETTVRYLSTIPSMKVFFYTTLNSRCANAWISEHQSELGLYSFTIYCEYLGLDSDDHDSSGSASP